MQLEGPRVGTFRQCVVAGKNLKIFLRWQQPSYIVKKFRLQISREKFNLPIFVSFWCSLRLLKPVRKGRMVNKKMIRKAPPGNYLRNTAFTRGLSELACHNTIGLFIYANTFFWIQFPQYESLRNWRENYRKRIRVILRRIPSLISYSRIGK